MTGAGCGWAKLGVITVFVGVAVAACGDASDSGSPSSSPKKDQNVQGDAGTDGPAGERDPNEPPPGGDDPKPPTPTPPGENGTLPAPTDLKCPALSMPPAATVYVDAAAAGAEAGTKAAPYKTIAKAFANAASKGVVWIAAGTYKETLTVPDKDLVIYGGFAAGFGSRTDACATILEPATATQTVLTASYDVKSFGLDGVTVQKGARGLTVNGDSSVQAMITIANAVFAENGKVDVEGGAVLLDRVNAKIARSAFRNNRAAKGAAVAHGGEVKITIEESLFEKNVGYSDHGGGLYLSPSSGTISRNTFRGNEIGKSLGYGWGGAAIVFKAGASPVKADFAYNVFTDNLAGVGGAVFVDDGASATMSHDLMYRNRSYRENGVARGGAIYVDGLGGPGQGSTLVADHLTVAFNDYDETGALAAQSRGGVVYLESYSRATFTNSLFWKNGNDALFGDGTTGVTVSYSISQNACGGGASCSIGAGVFQPTDVNFVDEAGNDFHEKSAAGHYSKGTWVKDDVTSPAIDNADPASGLGAEGAPNGGRANVGMYGGTAEASRSP